MKTSKCTKWILVIFLMMTAAFASFHLCTRGTVPEQTLLVEYAGKQFLLELSSLTLEDIHGERFTGTGERREISAKGLPLTDVFDAVLSDYSNANRVTLTASDGFSAVVTVQEWEEPGKVYLILQDDGYLQLVVFGDKDSKRSVKRVEQLLLEGNKQ